MDEAGYAWIDKQERPPGRKDADAQQCVIVWHVYNGCMVYNWRQAIDNHFITHWMRCPRGPGR